MLRLDLTLPTPAENVALDEALLDWAEAEGHSCEFLRLWESPTTMVVVGRSSRAQLEVDEVACRRADIPILRRSSGGAAIVAGTGCLMYAVVLSYQTRPELRDISRTHAYVLSRLADGLRPAAGKVRCAGTSDLVLVSHPHDRKFSGNSMRAKRNHVLYHGTLLYDFNVAEISKLLREPPRQPKYRASRTHHDFVCNLSLPRAEVVAAVDRAFPTAGQLTAWPEERVRTLVAERFSRDEWNLKFAGGS
jgi:lipoate-protein ligase A